MRSTEREPLDMIHDGVGTITHCAVSLRSIASALGRVGMCELSDEISDIASDLTRSSEEIRSGYSIDLTRQVRRAEEATGNMLAGMIAMAKQE